MAKFCGKCGSKLDETTGLCHKCNAKKLSNRSAETLKETGQQEAKTIPKKSLSKREAKKQKKADKKEKRAGWSAGKKVRRFFLKCILSVLLLAVLTAGGMGLLVYFQAADIPVISYILARSGLERKAIVSTNPMTDNYIPEENSIAFDEKTNLYYASNEIIVIFSNETTDAQKEAVISSINGKLVGVISELNMCQIKVKDGSTLEDLAYISDEIMSQFDFVIYATYDLATVTQEDTYAPNDPWKGDVTKEDWGDGTVDGSNWRIEAINAQNAWDYNDRFSEISIGICDSSFDVGHEDLKNVVSFPNEILESRNVVTPWWYDFKNFGHLKSWSVTEQQNYHGTHVAGIIGAEGDNNKGITGIVQNCKLLLAPLYRSGNMEAYLAWDSSIYANLSYLVKAGAKVINFSQGKTNFLAENKNKTAYTEEIIEQEGHLASISIAQLINSGYKDFIVVQSAGNGTSDTGKALDTKQNGWFASITNNSMTGHNNITIDEVRSHVIIVGAAEQTSFGFQCASFSNYGKQVDICAPGVNIYSTIPGEVFYDFQFSGGYGSASGTSMAASIVTGVCALTWSANPKLTANQVRETVCSYSRITVNPNPKSDSDTSYNMVDAELSVKAALNYHNNRAGQFDQSDVPFDAVEFNGHYYYVYDIDNITDWDMTQKYCESQGGYLATITSAEEDAFLYSYVVDAGYSSAMFGLSDHEETDDWRWVTGESFSYQNWQSGEPNHQGGNEHYGLYYGRNTDGTWNDEGGTNIEAGLKEADSMLNSSNAKKKIIVLMSDGAPNDGKKGDELAAYADEIKDSGVLIYTLGFFGNWGGAKSSAQVLMERIASDGCHYEAASADDLVFFFADMADQINGQKYIYVRIACPVNVSVAYQEQMLSSAENNLNLRTDFGTLTFEENEEAGTDVTDDRIKVLRLKEGTEYDLKLAGTGHGLMDYTIGFMDDEGNYSDLRKFENIKITKRTVIDTAAAASKASTLNIDENGDGKYDLRLRAGENGYGEEVKQNYFVYLYIGGCAVVLIVAGSIIACKIHTKKIRKKER